jgi:hypothetical protein
VSVIGLPSLDRLAEIGIAEGSEIAIVRDRVIVLGRDGVLHVVDPVGKEGPEKVGELQLDANSRILAVSGEHMIVALAGGAGVVSLAANPVLWRLPSRLAIGAAGPAVAADHFILAVGGALEEWSAITRSPLRRFRLEKPVAARLCGGGARHVWFAPEGELDAIVTIPMVGAARPTHIALGEPATRVAVDPTGAFVAALGSQSGALAIAGLGERSTAQLHPGKIDSFAWRGASSIVYTTGTVVEVVDVARASGAAPAPPVNGEHAEEPAVPLERTMSTAERLAAWKDRAARKDVEAASEFEVVTTRASEYDGESVPIHEWRDVVANWTRRQLSGARGEPPLLAAGPLYDVGLRLGISVEDAPFLWLVYGARLCGIDGVPPVELVPLTDQRWEGALGRGRLAATGAFAWRRSRVHLVPEIIAALDEVPPLYGSIATSAVAAERTVALVAPPEIDLGAIAAWAAPHVGSLLVPNARGLRAPGRLMLEARARGLVPLLPAQRLPRRELPSTPAALVFEQAAAALELRVPIALSWSATST